MKPADTLERKTFCVDAKALKDARRILRARSDGEAVRLALARVKEIEESWKPLPRDGEMKRKGTGGLTRCDLTEHLKAPEGAAVYLSQVRADGDYTELQRALGHITPAQSPGRAATKEEFLRLGTRSKARTQRKISRDEMHERR